MRTWKRIAISAAVAFATVAVVVALRRSAEMDPVVSYGLTGPGFLGFLTSWAAWWITGRT
jgi:hypothetical protein